MGGSPDEDQYSTATLNPFEQLSSQTNAPAAAPPPNVPQAQLKQFGFNPKYAGLSAGLERNVIDAGANRSNRLFQTEDLYKTQLGDAEKMQQTAIQRLRAILGGRGLLNSSTAIDQSAEQQQNYTKYVDNLGRIKGNQYAEIEGDYARSLEDVNRQREGLYFQQVQEEEEMARERARAEAENQRRAEEMAAQKQWQAEQQAAMQAQMAAQAAAAERQAAAMANWGGGGGRISAPSVGYSGPPAVGHLDTGEAATEDQFMRHVMATQNIGWLGKLWDNNYELSPQIRQAILSRIAQPRGYVGAGGQANLAAM